MGTTWSVLVSGDVSDEGALRRTIEAELNAVEDEMSHYRPGSEISRFNDWREPDWFPVSSAFAHVVATAQHIAGETSGALDVTCSPVLRLWGFGPRAEDRKIPSEEELARARQLVGHENLEFRVEPPALKKRTPSLRLDLSAVAKGHGVDRVARALGRAGFSNVLVEVGGEIVCMGEKGPGRPWTVAIERPRASGEIGHTDVALRDLAVATSGDYRNYWVEDGTRYSHVVDPRVARPVAHQTASVTVFAETCEAADAWATALLVMGAEEGMALAEREGLMASFVVRSGADGFDVSTSSAYRRRFSP